MHIRSALGLSLVTAALLASSAAFATPILNVAGIPVPAGPVQIDMHDLETLIDPATAPFLQGVGVVTSISNGALLQTYAGGSATVPYLYDEFSGFTLNTNPAATFVDSSGQLHLALQGGQLSFYTFASDQQANIAAAANATAAVNLVKGGTLWLSLLPQSEDAFGDTLLITLDSGNAATFGSASGTGFLDIIVGAGSGPANSAFKTCSKTDTNATGAACIPGLTNFSFVGGSSNTSGDSRFPVIGTDHINAIAVPEPISVSLFGAGLAGAAMFGRRKAKKA
jgi:hypothetical protein